VKHAGLDCHQLCCFSSPLLSSPLLPPILLEFLLITLFKPGNSLSLDPLYSAEQYWFVTNANWSIKVNVKSGLTKACSCRGFRAGSVADFHLVKRRIDTLCFISDFQHLIGCNDLFAYPRNRSVQFVDIIKIFTDLVHTFENTMWAKKFFLFWPSELSSISQSLTATFNCTLNNRFNRLGKL